jgi:hypothetical protein
MFKKPIILLIFIASLSSAQTVRYYPACDSIFIVSGCTQPMVYCNVIEGSNFIDTISITKSFNTRIFYHDSVGREIQIEKLFFMVSDSLREYKYQLIIFSKIYWDECFFTIPFDSSVQCVYYTAPYSLIFYVKKSDKVVSAGTYKLLIKSEGMGIEPDKTIRIKENSPRLYSNYPNPFNPSTKIPVKISKTEEIKFSIFDINGREVKTIFSGQIRPDSYLYEWDGTDNFGKIQSSGIYFSRIITKSGQIFSGKMLLIR